MITIDMFQIGEEVYIKAKVTDIKVENGELKYEATIDGETTPLTSKYSVRQLVPTDRIIPLKKEEEEEDNRK